MTSPFANCSRTIPDSPKISISPNRGRAANRLSHGLRAKLVDPAGARFRYSDINFVVLGALVERVSGMPLEEYCTQHIFTPLGMLHTRYSAAVLVDATHRAYRVDEHNKMLRGVVQDPTARRMGGVAGHAGVFSTADDLARFAQALLAGSSGLTSTSMLTLRSILTPSSIR